MNKPKTRRLAAIMFTDIVGYTALMQKDEETAADLRALHRQEFKRYHKIYHGEILQYFGDGTLSVFQSGVEAVECAIAIQSALKKGKLVPLRIGLHMGDIVFDGTDIYGDGVNLASRIESLSVAGAVLLSGKLNDELKNHHNISTRSLGYFDLKNIAYPVEVFSVTNTGMTIPENSELKSKQKQRTKTIAVLPFVNMSSNAENEYLSDGMTEEIINALSKIQNLKVTSRSSSFFFKHKKIPVPQIGRELNVSTILEGSIRIAGNKMRITAQLIDVADDYHFWSETFDHSMEDIFAVQDEVSLLIADKLREHVGHFDIADHLVVAPQVNVETYKTYLKGRYHILKMRRRDIETGMTILEEVIETHPRFTLALLAMHLGYAMLGTIGLIPSSEAFAKGKPFLDKAIALDPELPECQLHLSYISFLQKWNLEETYLHLNKALEKLHFVEAYQAMASTLVAEAKFKAALHHIEIAFQLDPFSSINHHLKGYIYYAREQYDKAIEFFKKSVSLKSDFVTSSLYWGQSLMLMGRSRESLEFFLNLPDEGQDDYLKLGGSTLAYAAMGNTEQAERGIAKLKDGLETESMERALNLLILCHAVLGNKKEAIRLIAEGIQYRLPMLVYLSIEPILKPLHAEPGFQSLMEQILGKRTDFEIPEQRHKKPVFNPDALKKHKEQLEELMLLKKPFLDPDLTLRSLATKMQIPPNRLSQLLNEAFDKNFAEYINAQRLETFKEKVADPGQQHLSIQTLAQDSGFNSKTVFNAYFKKRMGKTARAYWKEIVK